MVKKCGKDEILKKSYTTKKGTKVSATCIKDLGLKGKGPKVIPPLKKGTITQFGYSSNNSDIKRHNSLKKAIKGLDKATVIHKLNAVAVLTANTNPQRSSIFKSDMEWVQRQ